MEDEVPYENTAVESQKDDGSKKPVKKFGAQDKCLVCGKTVYVTEKIQADLKVFHKACFRCCHCHKVLKLGNYASLEGKYYCKPHFKQLFALKGNYNEGFGKKKLTKLWAEKQGQGEEEGGDDEEEDADNEPLKSSTNGSSTSSSAAPQVDSQSEQAPVDFRSVLRSKSQRNSTQLDSTPVAAPAEPEPKKKVGGSLRVASRVGRIAISDVFAPASKAQELEAPKPEPKRPGKLKIASAFLGNAEQKEEPAAPAPSPVKAKGSRLSKVSSPFLASSESMMQDKARDEQDKKQREQKEKEERERKEREEKAARDREERERREKEQKEKAERERQQREEKQRQQREEKERQQREQQENERREREEREERERIEEEQRRESEAQELQQTEWDTNQDTYQYDTQPSHHDSHHEAEIVVESEAERALREFEEQLQRDRDELQGLYFEDTEKDNLQNLLQNLGDLQAGQLEYTSEGAIPYTGEISADFTTDFQTPSDFSTELTVDRDLSFSPRYDTFDTAETFPSSQQETAPLLHTQQPSNTDSSFQFDLNAELAEASHTIEASLDTSLTPDTDYPDYSYQELRQADEEPSQHHHHHEEKAAERLEEEMRSPPAEEPQQARPRQGSSVGKLNIPNTFAGQAEPEPEVVRPVQQQKPGKIKIAGAFLGAVAEEKKEEPKEPRRPGKLKTSVFHQKEDQEKKINDDTDEPPSNSKLRKSRQEVEAEKKAKEDEERRKRQEEEDERRRHEEDERRRQDEEEEERRRQEEEQRIRDEYEHKQKEEDAARQRAQPQHRDFYEDEDLLIEQEEKIRRELENLNFSQQDWDHHKRDEELLRQEERLRAEIESDEREREQREREERIRAEIEAEEREREEREREDREREREREERERQYEREEREREEREREREERERQYERERHQREEEEQRERERREKEKQQQNQNQNQRERVGSRIKSSPFLQGNLQPEDEPQPPAPAPAPKKTGKINLPSAFLEHKEEQPNTQQSPVVQRSSSGFLSKNKQPAANLRASENKDRDSQPSPSHSHFCSHCGQPAPSASSSDDSRNLAALQQQLSGAEAEAAHSKQDLNHLRKQLDDVQQLLQNERDHSADLLRQLSDAQYQADSLIEKDNLIMALQQQLDTAQRQLDATQQQLKQAQQQHHHHQEESQPQQHTFTPGFRPPKSGSSSVRHGSINLESSFVVQQTVDLVSQTNKGSAWVVLSYSDNTFSSLKLLQASVDGDKYPINSLSNLFQDDQVQYALLKIDQDDLHKFVFVCWFGPHVALLNRVKAQSQLEDIRQLLQPSDSWISVFSKNNFTHDNVISLLSSSEGFSYHEIVD